LQVQPRVKTGFNHKCKEMNSFHFGEKFNYLFKHSKNRKEWPTENLVNLHLIWGWEGRRGEKRCLQVIL